jgi:hypothetical protein
MKKMLIKFEKNNLTDKKVVVTVIWIFALVALVLLVAITYQELITEQFQGRGDLIEILVGGGVGVLLISGLLSKSKTSRWIILLIAYIALLSPFVTYIMLKLFVPDLHKSLWEMFIILNIIMSVFIIVLLSNRVSLRLYELNRDLKRRIKEQIYLFALAAVLIALYTYYVTIPLLY